MFGPAQRDGGRKSALSRFNGNPSKLCQKSFTSHFYFLRSIEPGFWHS
jgi:hypothetical protein